MMASQIHFVLAMMIVLTACVAGSHEATLKAKRQISEDDSAALAPVSDSVGDGMIPVRFGKRSGSSSIPPQIIGIRYGRSQATVPPQIIGIRYGRSLGTVPKQWLWPHLMASRTTTMSESPNEDTLNER